LESVTALYYFTCHRYTRVYKYVTEYSDINLPPDGSQEDK